MPTTFLNLTDLDNRIRNLEHHHQATSYDMLTDESVRGRISEDVILKWETYVRQRAYLRELSDQKHSEYLSHIPKTKTGTRQQESDEVVLAA